MTPDRPSSGHAAPVATPLEALRAGVRHRQLSVEARRTLRVLGRVALATLTALLSSLLPEHVRNLPLAVASGYGLFVLSRWLLLERALRRVWLGLGLPTLALLLFGGDSALGSALFGTVGTAFLILRRYRCFRPVGSKWRSLIFLFSVAAWVGLLAAPGVHDAEGWLAGGLQRTAATFRFLLALFWALCALHLFLGMRLHFLRLRPKLAIAGLLIAAVPLVLIVALAGVAVFGLLGAQRSGEARALLEEWRALAEEGALTGAGPFESAFGEWGESAPPAWVSRIEEQAARSRLDPFPGALYLRVEDQLWLLRLRRGQGSPSLLAGARIGPSTLRRMADRLGCRVSVLDSSGDEELRLRFDSGGLDTGLPVLGSGERTLAAAPTGAEPVADSTSTREATSAWTERWLGFGLSPVQVWKSTDREFTRGRVLLALQVQPQRLVQEWTGDENPMNQGVLVVLAIFTLLFLFLEGIALFFGLRIVGGITAAVGRLHHATERLARGDLDTWIELENEDEFGDLASSFNEMTGAIRVAQHEIVEKQKLELELSTARRIQQRLLPDTMPRIDGWEVCGSSEPTLHVGGDYFDFLPLPDGRWGIAVGDVTGKGVPAALLMANLQACLQGQVIHEQAPAKTVEMMNDLLCASTDPHMFVTFVYAVLDPASGELLSVNAGHEPLLLVRADGRVEHLRGGGLVLGMLPGQNYVQIRAELEPGDVVVAYTDGITEAMGPLPDGRIPRLPSPETRSDDGDDEEEEVETNFFDLDRLVEVVREHRHRSAEAIRDAILGAVRRFVQDVPQSDDITLVVLKRATR